MSVKYLNPDGLHKNPAFSQVVTTEVNVRTVYVGGQNAVTSSVCGGFGGRYPALTRRTTCRTVGQSQTMDD